MPQRFIFFDRPWSDSEYAIDFWFQRNCSVMKVKGKPVSYVNGKVIPWDVAQEVGMSDRNIRRSVRKLEDTILNHADNPSEINDIDMSKFDMLEYDMKEDKTYWRHKFDEGWRFAEVDKKIYDRIYDSMIGRKDLVMVLRVYGACKAIDSSFKEPEITNKVICKTLGISSHGSRNAQAGKAIETLANIGVIEYKYKMSKITNGQDCRFRKLVHIV
jgi:hypothetical protein